MTNILNTIEDIKAFNNKNLHEPGPYRSFPQAHVSYPAQTSACSIITALVGVYGTIMIGTSLQCFVIKNFG